MDYDAQLKTKTYALDYLSSTDYSDSTKAATAELIGKNTNFIDLLDQSRAERGFKGGTSGQGVGSLGSNDGISTTINGKETKVNSMEGIREWYKS
jgi:hypothetical protein